MVPPCQVRCSRGPECLCPLRPLSPRPREVLGGRQRPRRGRRPQPRQLRHRVQCRRGRQAGRAARPGGGVLPEDSGIEASRGWVPSQPRCIVASTRQVEAGRGRVRGGLEAEARRPEHADPHPKTAQRDEEEEPDHLIQPRRPLKQDEAPRTVILSHTAYDIIS